MRDVVQRAEACDCIKRERMVMCAIAIKRQRERCYDIIRLRQMHRRGTLPEGVEAAAAVAVEVAAAVVP